MKRSKENEFSLDPDLLLGKGFIKSLKEPDQEDYGAIVFLLYSLVKQETSLGYEEVDISRHEGNDLIFFQVDF